MFVRKLMVLKQVSNENIAGFSDIYAALSESEKQKLAELAQQVQQ